MKCIVTGFSGNEEFYEKWDTCEEARERQLLLLHCFVGAEKPEIKVRIDEVEE